MSDVCMNPVSGQPVHNGWATVYVDQLGNSQELQGNQKDDDITPSGIRLLYDTRFDDIGYYST